MSDVDEELITWFRSCNKLSGEFITARSRLKTILDHLEKYPSDENLSFRNNLKEVIGSE